MSGYVVALVLFAAALHAGWNAIAKHIPSRLATSTLIGLSYLVGGAVGLLLLPLPATGRGATWRRRRVCRPPT